MSTIDGFVPTKTFNWYQMPNQSILSRIKRFRGTKPEQIVVRISQHIRTTIRQSSPIHNRITDLSYTAMYTHPQTKRQRNGSTDMDTVPRKIGIRRVIPCRFPPQTVRKVLARLKYPVPLHKARSGFSILTEECLTFRTTSPDYP